MKTTNGISFEHRLAAHCETGTTRNILLNHGLDISEAMVFGIGAGIFFGYFHFSNFTFPRVVNRSRPGSFLKGVPKRLGVKGTARKYWSKAKAAAELDGLLDQGHAVSLQVDMFNMDYVGNDFRIHANVHFINAIGRAGDNYLVSDAYFPELGNLSRKSMELGRFARGDINPRGFMYHPVEIPKNPPVREAVLKGLKDACFYMLKIPILPLGIKGMRRFANKITDWPAIAGTEDKLARELLWFAIVMEDMGTGGAGFRYMYATFLQEAADLLGNDAFLDFSKRMRENGDKWRELTVKVLRMGRNRDLEPVRFEELRALIHERADCEEGIFRQLSNVLKGC